ncbi:MAG: FtsQ-type POTRA domain-containing protein [Syntrophorhabdaceae bacterium]|nr:FtsQ-type POTRA domain-containing protein [Syntrophorhabdaceae bacterium]
MKKVLFMLFITPLCVLSILTLVYLFSSDMPLFIIKNIKVRGIKQLTDNDVMSRLWPYMKDGTFNIDVTKIREAVLSHPFVSDVTIIKVYPFSVVIDVKEKRLAGLWVDNGGNIMILDENGEPFRGLSKGAVRDMFIINAKDKNIAKCMLKEINTWISEGLIKKEDISEIACRDGSITLFLVQDGIEIVLGKEDLKKRLKRAMVVLEDAKKRGLLIKCIDARFEKGAIIQERQV